MMKNIEEAYGAVAAYQKQFNSLPDRFQDLTVDMQNLLLSFADRLEEEMLGTKKEYLLSGERERIRDSLEDDISKIGDLKELLAEQKKSHSEIFEILDDLDDSYTRMIDILES